MKIVKQFEKHLSLFLYNNFDKFYMRSTISVVKDIFGNNPVTGLEIGVDCGHHSANILRMLNIKKLYLVDCFIENDMYGNDIERVKELKKRLYKYKNKCQLVVGKSNEVDNLIPNGLDFVYIDGGHDYDTVMSDCRCYYPKVNKGGVLGGHDYEIRSDVGHAVKDFCSYLDCDLFTCKRRDWWIIKSNKLGGIK